MKNYFAAASAILLTQPLLAQNAVIPARPLTPIAQWFHGDDYLPAAMRGNEEGNVSALLSIDAQGMVSGCRVTHSSGHPLLDQATCALAVRRGRFVPARDAQMHPAEGRYVISDLKWRINGIVAPSGGPPIVAVSTPVVASLGVVAAAQDGFVQDQAQFRAALENGSTSPYFVLVTVVDGSSGQRRTGCTMAGFLLHAIVTEEGLDRRDDHGRMLPDVSARVMVKALASKNHVYILHRAEALAAVPTDVQGSKRACEIIRSGSPAYMQDRNGQIMPGQQLVALPAPSGRPGS